MSSGFAGHFAHRVISGNLVRFLLLGIFVVVLVSNYHIPGFLLFYSSQWSHNSETQK